MQDDTEIAAIPARRSQAERRAGTTRRLLDAATAALIEVGYYRTTVQDICSRAGLSQGALFRHYATRLQLLIAVAEDIERGLRELYRSDFLRLKTSREDELRLALDVLRANVRSPLHQAWFELLIAARTDAALHEALLPLWRRRAAEDQALATLLLPEAARALPDFAVIVDTMVTLFHGEGVDRFLRHDAAAEDRRLEWLLTQLRPLLSSAAPLP
ncbi:TetR/AcrR family transcriptional regulator [uncultured Nevskia sp.]|uniref:TetR/AcrR family transcriptional regulator n=1 Tax=uncultured Nevskia sp. TaxID=228950 RepID=UPI0025E92C9F|nr:TetR/AcrR family transcriptional regulator [uncultured Nevskia sp.]